MNALSFFNLYLSQVQSKSDCLINTTLCSTDKSLTPSSIVFIFISLAFFVVTSFIFIKHFQHEIRDIFILLLGILLFEIFTAPLWNTAHLGSFGYIYLDLSWILTLAWGGAFMTSIMLVDHFLKKHKLRVRYFFYLAPMLIFTLLGELSLANINVRTYAPEVWDVSIGFIQKIPIEVFYYAPVFSGLVLAFFLFWKEVVNGRPFVPQKKRLSMKNFLTLSAGVFCYELLVEPLVLNQFFPAWSYIYLDISIVKILLWMLVIWLATLFVDFFVTSVNYIWRFILYISMSSLILFQIESWLIRNQFRVYSASTTDNFTGIVTPFSSIPIEIAFAIPMYLAIVLSFVAFWRMTIDNNL